MEYQSSGRALQKNHGAAMPRHIIALDCETVPEQCTTSGRKFRHRFRLGCVVSGQFRRNSIGSYRVDHINNTEQFWQILTNASHHRHTVWVVCTNALFDLVTIGLQQAVSSGRFTLDAPRSKRADSKTSDSNNTASPLVCLESPPFILGLRCQATQGRIVFVDTLNWLKASVAELGKSVGLEKLPMPEFSESDEVWKEYCQRDAEITFKAFIDLVKWSKQNDFGVFRYTAASQAMGAFRHRFMPCEIHFHDNVNVKHLERKSFIGGRIECFRIGNIDEQVYQLDANSLYPSVMQSGLFPRRLNVYDLDSTKRPLPNLGGWHRCVAEVDIETDKPLYPLRQDGITIYPTGNFRTILCGVELDHAVRCGHVKSVGRWSKYKLAPLFTSFVDELWRMRSTYKLAGNEAYANCTKAILNSLFGKFAQRPIKWVHCPDRIECLDWSQWCEVDHATRQPIMYRSIGGHVYKQNQEIERQDTLIAISAFIAAAARVKMNEYREIAGVKNVYYQGVDGLLVNGTGYQRLSDYGSVSDTEIGKLRLQKTSDSLHIYNCADYRIGATKVIAGRPSRSITKADGREELRKFSGQEALFAGPGIPAVYEKIVEWQRRGEYRKGEAGENGWIKPFMLGV
jgi:hypothetical protein